MEVQTQTVHIWASLPAWQEPGLLSRPGRLRK
jgi:hypothetical protein